MIESVHRALAEARWSDARAACEEILANDPEDVGALEALGKALAWLEDVDRSFEVREKAYRLLSTGGEKRDAARLAIAIALDAADFQGMAVAEGWLARAKTLLASEPPSPEHGWLALWDGHFHRGDGDLQTARERAEEAKRIANQLQISDLGLLAIALEGLINVTEGQVREGMRQLDEATAAALAGEMADITSVLNTCCLLMHACERVSDWERAAQWRARIDMLAERWQVISFFATCQAEHAATLIGRGEWERAEQELNDALRLLETRRPLAMYEAIVQLAELRRRQGRTDEAVELFNRAPTSTESIIGLAAIALDAGDRERALSSLERLRRRNLAEKWLQRATVLELIARAGDDGSEEAATELRDLAARVGIELIAAMAKATEARLSADDQKARMAFEDAIDLYERAGAPWEAARVRLELAAVLRRLRRDSFAREEEDAAHDTLRRLGVVQGRSSKPPLTKREIEVLKLVAAGMSDKEVAIHLRLSEHTVHRHMSNVLAKLDLPSRAAAVARATADGWMA